MHITLKGFPTLYVHAYGTHTHTTHTHTHTHQVSEEDSGEGATSAEDSQQRHDLEEKLRQQLCEAEMMVQQLEEESKSKGGSLPQHTHTYIHTHTTIYVHTDTRTHVHTYVYVPSASFLFTSDDHSSDIASPDTESKPGSRCVTRCRSFVIATCNCHSAVTVSMSVTALSIKCGS